MFMLIIIENYFKLLKEVMKKEGGATLPVIMTTVQNALRMASTSEHFLYFTRFDE